MRSRPGYPKEESSVAQAQALRPAAMTGAILTAIAIANVCFADTAIPETVAGKHAAALIEAFNTGLPMI